MTRFWGCAHPKCGQNTFFGCSQMLFLLFTFFALFKQKKKQIKKLWFSDSMKCVNTWMQNNAFSIPFLTCGKKLSYCSLSIESNCKPVLFHLKRRRKMQIEEKSSENGLKKYFNQLSGVSITPKRVIIHNKKHFN